MIDEKQIKEWAEHECYVESNVIKNDCQRDFELHAERRELARMVLSGSWSFDRVVCEAHQPLIGEPIPPCPCCLAVQERERAEKAEAARDALAAALVECVRKHTAPVNQDALVALNALAPGWRAK